MIKELNEYQKEAAKTLKEMSQEETVKYLAMKMCEESGEVISLVAKHYYHGKEFNLEKLKEELGDVCFYVANLANTYGVSLADIATENIDKLRARHGEKYRKEFYVQ